MTGMAAVVGGSIAVAAAAHLVWMGFALGAVLRKLGGQSWRAWVPVLRWVAAAKHAEVSTTVVMVARSIALAGGLAWYAGLLGAIAQADQPAATWRVLLLAGGTLWTLGTLTGWAMWIYGAGYLQLTLRAPTGFTWLAAISPPLWAAVLGWGSYGRRDRAVTQPISVVSPAVAVAEDAPADDAEPAGPASPFALVAEPDGPRPAPPVLATPAAPMPPSRSAASAPSAGEPAADTGAVASLPPGWMGAPALAEPEDDEPGEHTIIPPELLAAPEPTSEPDPPQPPPLLSPYLAGLPTEAPRTDPTPPEPEWDGPALPPQPPEPAPRVDASPATMPTPALPPTAAPVPAPEPGDDDRAEGAAGVTAGVDPADTEAVDEDNGDRTVLARRRRDLWVLDVAGASRYPLPEEGTSIGRVGPAPRPDVLGIADHTRTISKVHAALFMKDGRWWVKDLGSTNGTALRDEHGVEREVDSPDGAPVEGTLLLGDLEARIVPLDGDGS